MSKRRYVKTFESFVGSQDHGMKQQWETVNDRPMDYWEVGHFVFDNFLDDPVDIEEKGGQVLFFRDSSMTAGERFVTATSAKRISREEVEFEGVRLYTEQEYGCEPNEVHDEVYRIIDDAIEENNGRFTFELERWPEVAGIDPYDPRSDMYTGTGD